MVRTVVGAVQSSPEAGAPRASKPGPKTGPKGRLALLQSQQSLGQGAGREGHPPFLAFPRIVIL